MAATTATNDSLVMLLSITFLFLILGTGISVFVIYYYNKRRAYIKEKDELKIKFENSLMQSQLEIQEYTLNHISQEIHDNVGQVLSLTKMQLNIIEQSELLDRIALQEAKESLSKAIFDLRDIAKGLSTERIGHFSLTENIKEELTRIQRSRTAEVSFMTEGPEKEICEEKKLILFRMIQECLQNIIKHARASKISLLFLYQDSMLNVVIRDDGIGFDVPLAVQEGMGLGLQNIVSRAAVIGGSASIRSTINEGTNVNIIIPYV